MFSVDFGLARINTRYTELRKSLVEADNRVLTRIVRKGCDDIRRSSGRLIGGYASTEDRDRQHEVLLAKGLDFTPAIHHGWYNDNHDASTSSVVGIPLCAELHQHPTHGLRWYTDGILLEGTPRADAIWALAKALERVGESLKFSVEGDVLAKDANENAVQQAVIKNIAVTAEPVNVQARWQTLSKALNAHTDALTRDQAVRWLLDNYENMNVHLARRIVNHAQKAFSR